MFNELSIMSMIEKKFSAKLMLAQDKHFAEDCIPQLKINEMARAKNTNHYVLQCLTQPTCDGDNIFIKIDEVQFRK